MHTPLQPRLPAFLLFLAALLTDLGPAQVPGGQGAPRALSISGFVVRPSSGIDPAQLAAEHGLTLEASITSLDVHLLRPPQAMGTADRAALLQALDQSSATVFAERDGDLGPPEVDGCSAGGSVHGQQCTIAFYDGTPSPEEYFDQPAGAAIRAAQAQAHLGAHTVLVAVIDTGVDPTHSMVQPFLATPGYDFVEGRPGGVDEPNGADDDFDGLVDEAYGHGTHVSSTITLINPNARILPYRVLDSDGNGKVFDVARAIERAVIDGAEVINLSLGMHARSDAVVEAILFARGADVDVVAAAGNTGAKYILFPARHPRVIAVTAVDPSDLKAPFSAYGGRVAVSAPGVDVYAAMPGEAYAWWSGTSMATAVSTGALSLLHAVQKAQPEDGEDDWNAAELLGDTAVEIDDINGPFAEYLGEGRIDVEAAATDLVDDDQDDD